MFSNRFKAVMNCTKKSNKKYKYNKRNKNDIKPTTFNGVNIVEFDALVIAYFILLRK